VVQAWTVEGDARSVLLLSPGFLWRIAPGPAGYDETFDEVAADGRATRVVALRHVRRKDAAQRGPLARDRADPRASRRSQGEASQ
jgi:hypothetical protein